MGMTIADIHKLIALECQMLGITFSVDSLDNPDTLGFFDADTRRLVLRTTYQHHRSGKWREVSMIDQVLTAFHELRHAMQWASGHPGFTDEVELDDGTTVVCSDLYDEYENGEVFYTIQYRRLGAAALASLEQDADEYAFQMADVYGFKCKKSTKVWTSNRILYSYYLCAETGINLSRPQLKRLVPYDMQDDIGVRPEHLSRMLQDMAANPAYYRRYSLGYWKSPTKYINHCKPQS